MKHFLLLLAFLSASLMTVKAQDTDSVDYKLPQTYQRDSVEQYVFAQLPDTVESPLNETRLVFSAVDKYLPEAWHQYLITPAGDKVLDNVYHVVGIPRFIVVGRDGKIISADSMRPSEKEFGKWFDGLVNNK